MKIIYDIDCNHMMEHKYDSERVTCISSRCARVSSLTAAMHQKMPEESFLEADISVFTASA